MEEIRLVIAVIISLVFVPIYAIGIAMLFGKCGSLIAGYNKSPKTVTKPFPFEHRLIAGYNGSPRSLDAKRAHTAIVRRSGILILSIVACLHVCIVSGILNIMTVCYIALACTVTTSAVGVVAFNTDKKVKKLLAIVEESEREYDASHPQTLGDKNS